MVLVCAKNEKNVLCFDLRSVDDCIGLMLQGVKKLNSTVETDGEEFSPRTGQTEMTSRSTHLHNHGNILPVVALSDDNRDTPHLFTPQKFGSNYLQALDEMTKASHPRLESSVYQNIAKHNLVEAISAVRSTLAPLKRIGPDFGSGYKWSGGTVVPDGKIYFAPHGHDHVRSFITLVVLVIYVYVLFLNIFFHCHLTNQGAMHQPN